MLEVSGHVGGEVIIHCSGSWSTNNCTSNMYFCKGVCSRENILIQTERKTSAVTQRGRYSIEISRGDGVFNVTIKRLKKADAGGYHCGVEGNFKALYQKVNLKVLDASTVPPGSPSSTTTLQTETETLPQGSFPSSAEPSPAAAVTLSATDEKTNQKTNQKAARTLTDTTVVIIVSVSLALLVCAIIPLIFYGHWRSNAVSEGQNGNEADKGEGDYSEETAVVRLQSLEPDVDPESSAQDASQYAAIYQALDPKTLD
ncbi:uncharacterized protein LOC122978932 [Thunnus albacares]|uniref:uncharacterized protein LOC122978932 n=1 Tax=Thunnus albacares TaxID=8236 RepID=UPI001CF60CE7|nr:uncharacterized protein LOC122978932 [Thunnus albacares]